MLPDLHHAEGGAYVNVITRALGQVVLQTVARFPDGGETHTEAVVNVRPPDLPRRRLLWEISGQLSALMCLRHHALNQKLASRAQAAF